MSTKNELPNIPQAGEQPPEGVPSWILGLSFLISSILSSGVAAYLAVQNSVDNWVNAEKEIKILEIQSRNKQYDKEHSELSQVKSSVSELGYKLDSKQAQLAKDLDKERAKVRELEQKLLDNKK